MAGFWGPTLPPCQGSIKQSKAWQHAPREGKCCRSSVHGEDSQNRGCRNGAVRFVVLQTVGADVHKRRSSHFLPINPLTAASPGTASAGPEFLPHGFAALGAHVAALLCRVKRWSWISLAHFCRPFFRVCWP